MFTVHDCGFELIDHLPYSPNLAPSDYFLLPNMKKHVAGKRYWINCDVISAVRDFLAGQEDNFYTTKIQALQHRSKKSIDRRGNDIEK